ncbi:hypothetical protein CYLTODRAFT_459746 [Cylindrobasidium torrendii FP15055 ss-10]|uniref:RanBD1 domain-containing protein n=1 Tax=Cylindrobasidium torrendii FP15055 ss-10 TaxID=1314674 RepID=A0A0D7AUP8_9AGAR|nr:hypothetical protein CYLTODRAFT_459746 [Cylindrobasidium torrendii FP15055 ss-10]
MPKRRAETELHKSDSLVLTADFSEFSLNSTPMVSQRSCPSDDLANTVIQENTTFLKSCWRLNRDFLVAVKARICESPQADCTPMVADYFRLLHALETEYNDKCLAVLRRHESAVHTTGSSTSVSTETSSTPSLTSSQQSPPAARRVKSIAEGPSIPSTFTTRDAPEALEDIVFDETPIVNVAHGKVFYLPHMPNSSNPAGPAWAFLGEGTLQLIPVPQFQGERTKLRLFMRNDVTQRVIMNFIVYRGFTIGAFANCVKFVGPDENGGPKSYSMRVRDSLAADAAVATVGRTLTDNNAQ